MFYFYVLGSDLGKLYYGSSNDLKHRLKEHLSGEVFTTKKHSGWKLIYYEAYANEEDARLRERNVKKFGGTKKHLLNRIRRSRQFG